MEIKEIFNNKRKKHFLAFLNLKFRHIQRQTLETDACIGPLQHKYGNHKTMVEQHMTASVIF